MTHGRPDYGITNAARTTYQIADAGEMAVRLGSPVSYDRRGDVTWWDDFECGIAKWRLVNFGAGGSVALSTLQARNGANSALITTPVGADAGTGLIHDHAIPVRSRLGVEFSFLSLPAGAGGPDSFDMRITQLDSVTSYRAFFRLDLVNLTLNVMNAAGAYVQVGPTITGLSFITNLWHTVKLVWDAATHAYVRLLFDDLSFDISAIGMQAAATPASFYLDIFLRSYGNAGATTTFYVDDVILTQNEP